MDVINATQHYVETLGTVCDPSLVDLAKTEFICFTILIIALAIIFCVYRCTRLDDVELKYMRKYDELNGRIKRLEEKRK